jgi:hypothetical protein
MKKVLSTIILIVVFSSAFAQEERNRSFSFQTNLFVLMDLILNIGDDPETTYLSAEFEFQYALNNYFVLSFTPYFSFFKHMSRGYLDSYGNFTQKFYGKQWQLLLTPGIIYKPFGTGLKGMFIGLYPTIGWANISQDSSFGSFGNYYETFPAINDNFTLLGFGLLSGYQWVFKNGFTIALGGGVRKIWQIESKDNTGLYSAILPPILIHLRLGYSF